MINRGQFSRRLISSGIGRIDVVLFGKDRIRLRAYSGMSLQEAVGIIRMEIPWRTKLFVYDEVPTGIENLIETSETLVQMRRNTVHA